MLTGLVVWNYVTAVTAQGCHAFLVAETYIRQYPSPLAILSPANGAGRPGAFQPGTGRGAGGTALLEWPARLAGALESAPQHAAAVRPRLVAWRWLAGCANVVFRDTEHLLQVGFQILFYGTPIIYPRAAARHGYSSAGCSICNPVVPFLDLFREPILHGACPRGTAFVGAAAAVVLLAAAAALVAARLQRRLIFYL